MKPAAYSIIGVLVLLIDRAFKLYAQNLPLSEGFLFFPGLQFKYSLNPSLFFFPAWSWIPWIALIVLIALTTFYVLRFTSSSYLLPILLGGLSNVFDRLAYGGVVDYVEISGLARINLADILILAGLLGLIFKSSK